MRQTGQIVIILLVGMAFGALLFWFVIPEQSTSPNKNGMLSNPIQQPGMKVLQDYQCRYAEKKIIIINGIEDNYSPTGEEPTRPLPRLGIHKNPVIPQRNYDEGGLDRNFIDHFELPVDITSGVFVIGLRPLGKNNNDRFNIGDTTSSEAGELNQYYELPTVEIQSDPAWVSQNRIHWVGLDKLIIRKNDSDLPGTRFKTVLEFVQNGKGKRIVDFTVSDDTQVDFAAVAICQKPPLDKGLTYFNVSSSTSKLQAGIHAISCSKSASTYSMNCDLFRGNTSCDTLLPLACFNDLGLPVPEKFAERTRFWSGGNLALTRERRGDSFTTIAEANAFCRLEFGAEWRVASFHDGRGPITSSIPIRGPKGSAWVDIKDQPYATCWARGEERQP